MKITHQICKDQKVVKSMGKRHALISLVKTQIENSLKAMWRCLPNLKYKKKYTHIKSWHDTDWDFYEFILYSDMYEIN